MYHSIVVTPKPAPYQLPAYRSSTYTKEEMTREVNAYLASNSPKILDIVSLVDYAQYPQIVPSIYQLKVIIDIETNTDYLTTIVHYGHLRFLKMIRLDDYPKYVNFKEVPKMLPMIAMESPNSFLKVPLAIQEQLLGKGADKRVLQNYIQLVQDAAAK